MKEMINLPQVEPLTMSSREIAELTGKRHDNVMRDIRDMLSQLHGEAALLKFEGSYVGHDNTSRPCFHLPKRETLILVSGYSVELRARIIDRWQELEGQAANGGFAVPKSLPEALRLAADLADKMQEQARAIETMRPKVEAHDKIAESFGSVCRRDRGAGARGCALRRAGGDMVVGVLAGA